MRWFTVAAIVSLAAGVGVLIVSCTTEDNADLSQIETRLSDLENRLDDLKNEMQREDCLSFAEFQELSAYQEYLADNRSYENYERVHKQYEDLVDACDEVFGDPTTRVPTSLDDYLDWVEQQR